MRSILLALLLIAATFFISTYSGDCVEVKLLGYSGKGELVPVLVCRTGHSGAFVEAGTSGTGFSRSVHVAYTVYNLRHGPIPFGILVKVNGPIEYIDGRSADIAIYSAIHSLLTGKTPPLATGKIGDDGYTVEGVAYVREKFTATSGRPLIIPYSNRHEVPSDAPAITVRNLDELDSVLASLPS